MFQGLLSPPSPDPPLEPFVRPFSQRLFGGFQSNFTCIFLRARGSAAIKMVDLDLLFKVTEVKLWPFWTFLTIFFMSFVWISFKLYIIITWDIPQCRQLRWSTLTYFSRSQRSNFDLFDLILWFPKDNLWMHARISLKFCIHTYFIGASPGIGARQNPRIFNEAAALWLVETYGFITLFLIVGF